MIYSENICKEKSFGKSEEILGRAPAQFHTCGTRAWPHTTRLEQRQGRAAGPSAYGSPVPSETWQRRLPAVGDVPKVTQTTGRGQKRRAMPCPCPLSCGSSEEGRRTDSSLRPPWLPTPHPAGGPRPLPDTLPGPELHTERPSGPSPRPACLLTHSNPKQNTSLCDALLEWLFC